MNRGSSHTPTENGISPTPKAQIARAACLVLSAAIAGTLVMGAALPDSDADPPIIPVAYASAAEPAATAALVRTDPAEVARLGRARYAATIRDYTCVFLKQERLGGKLGKREEIEVRFRENPKSIYMFWRRNTGDVRRSLMIDNNDFVDKKGRKVARVEPNGAIVRLFCRDIKIPIHGKRARAASRRSMDNFGFAATFDLLDEYNTRANRNGELDFRYAGEGVVDGRPTYKLVRYLPYTGEGGQYPDALMVLHLDQEWLLPTAVYSYADHAGKKLLGSYVFTKVKLNVGLSDADFQF